MMGFYYLVVGEGWGGAEFWWGEQDGGMGERWEGKKLLVVCSMSTYTVSKTTVK